jgi:intracellular septation protein
MIWAGYFFIVGGLNLVVAYNFTEEFWVTYKLASSVGFTLLMTLITALIVAPYVKDEPPGTKPSTDTRAT